MIKDKFKQAYMKTAEIFADLSHARRLHVGAIIVKDDRIISIGYNGMPAGWDNNCEYEVYEEVGDDTETVLKTKPEVLHAETNAILNAAYMGVSTKDCILFCTHAPCLKCTKELINAVLQANKLGISLEQAKGISESMLDFESSISKELEAELSEYNAKTMNYNKFIEFAKLKIQLREIIKKNEYNNSFRGCGAKIYRLWISYA